MNYPDDFINKVICGDCIETMKEIPDKAIDLVYADPPFNTGNKIGWSNRSYGPKGNDNLTEELYQEFCNKWFTEARRISKRLVLTPGAGNVGRYPNPLWCIKIDKPSSPSFNKFGGFNCWEPLYCYDKPLKKLPRDEKKFDSLNFIKDGRQEHPCPDNPAMVKWIVDMWTIPGELCLDPFGGSGTLALVCKEFGRNFIIIDIIKNYCELSKRRLFNVIPDMFLTHPHKGVRR